jgi:proton-coupled amino acid transporter
MHLLNGYIGSGILAMPKAFSEGGIVVSSIATPIFGLLMNGCIHLLVRVNAHLCDKLCVDPMDYEEVRLFHKYLNLERQMFFSNRKLT